MLFIKLLRYISNPSMDLILIYVSPRGFVSPGAFDIDVLFRHPDIPALYEPQPVLSPIGKEPYLLRRLERTRWVVGSYDMGLSWPP
jgi:hypothetical protein